MSAQFCTQCGARLEPNARFCTACGTAVSAPASSQSAAKAKPRSTPKPFPWPLALLIVGLFLVAAGVGYSVLSSDDKEEVAVPLDTAGLPFPEIARISAEETKARVDGGTAVVVDVRSAEEYAIAHISGAVSIPVGEIQARSGELNPNAEIITYCT